MSCEIKRGIFNFFIAITLSTTCLISVAHAYTMMVCQTPTFWCTFPMQGYGAPSGQPCYCPTYAGVVTGLSINPNVSLPTPSEPTSSTEPRPSSQTNKVPENVEDCLNGLGNCVQMAGNFSSIVQMESSSTVVNDNFCTIQEVDKFRTQGKGKTYTRKICGSVVTGSNGCETSYIYNSLEKGVAVTVLESECN